MKAPQPKHDNPPKIAPISLNQNLLNAADRSGIFKTEIANIEIYTPYEPYETQVKYVKYVIDRLNSKSNGVIQSPTGTGKTISLLSSTLGWLHANQNKFAGQGIPQIIFTSRTHQQLKQSVAELKKLPYHLKVCNLSSRDQSCINPDLRELKGKDLGFECRSRIMQKGGKTCTFYKQDSYMEKLPHSNKIKDLDEQMFLGKCERFCPYFYSKSLKESANVIFMPYNYLFETKEEAEISLSNNIVIIDEAHNIQQMLEGTKEFSITLSLLSRALGQISDLHERKLTEQKENNKSTSQLYAAEQQKLNSIKSSVESLQFHAAYVTKIHFYLQTIDIPQGTEGKTLSIKDFISLLETATKDSEFGEMSQKVNVMMKDLKNIRSDLSLRPFWALESWISFVQLIDEMAHILKSEQNPSQHKIQILYEGSDIKLNVFCLDPSIAMSKITKSWPLSIIFTSGTLSPMKSFSRELKLQNIPLESCPHIIEPSQVRTYVLTKGPTMALNFSYHNRENRKMYEELWLVLVEIIKNTPNGVVVFFPSYSMLEEADRAMTSSKAMSKIYEHKVPYIEKRNSKNFSQVMDSFIRDAQKPKGAVLFAPVRGKISQGLDLADQKCRAVILVGVPYPARRDIKVMSKMQYLDDQSKKSDPLKDSHSNLKGQEWYMSETIRSLNQGIGRIIRHKKDWGKIYLLDERYAKDQPDLKSQISSWARASLTVLDDYYVLAEEFRKLKEEKNKFLPVPKQKKEAPLLDNRLQSFSGQFAIKDSHPSKTTSASEKGPNSLKSLLSEIKTENELKNSKTQTSEKSSQKTEKSSKLIEVNSRQKDIFSKVRMSVPGKQQLIKPQQFLQECAICRHQKELLKNSECVHRFCEECWKIMLQKDLRCPICRIRMREKYIQFK